MALIFITGISGSGKTTVKKELVHRNYIAYDTDESGLTIWINKRTGEPAEPKPSIQYGTPQWYETFLWTLQADKVREKAVLALGETVFMCGIPGNWRDMISMFDQVFCLTINDETLRHRLRNRSNNDYGKAPYELRDILEANKSREAECRKLGATIIDAPKPVEKIVDSILARLE